MEPEFKLLNDEVIIELDPLTLRSSKLLSLAHEAFAGKGLDELKGMSHHRGYGNFPNCKNPVWFADGVDCKIVDLASPTSVWKKGKIRLKVSLEFCPEEAEETVLDGFRS